MFELAARNRRKSLLLVVAFFLVFAAFGYSLGEVYLGPDTGPVTLVAACLIAFVLFLVAYFSGDSVLLGMVGATEVRREQLPQLHNVVDEMVIASALGAAPRVYVIENNVPNAFAIGRSPQASAVAVTSGLLRVCNREELQAVIGHEIAHIKHQDVLFMTLLSVMMGAISLLSDVFSRGRRSFGGRSSRSSGRDSGGQGIILVIALLCVVLGPIVAKLVLLAVSRRREYLADAGSVIFTRNPVGLANALEKISLGSKLGALAMPEVGRGMLIFNAASLSTHPPVEERILILRKLAGGPSLTGAYARAFQEVTGKGAGFIPPDLAPAAKPLVAPMAPSQAVAGPAVAAPMPFVPPSAPSAPNAGAQLRREALDALKLQSGFVFHQCACGARTKIPAGYPKDRKLSCALCAKPIERRA